MRRLPLVCLTLFLSAGLALSVAFSVNAQTASQYDPSRGDPAPEDGAAPPGSEEEFGGSGGATEQGTIPEGPAAPAPEADPGPGAAPGPQPNVNPEAVPTPASVEADVAQVAEDPYFQVVDKASAPSGGAKAVTYEVNVPEDGAYSVYARWPVGKNNATAARFVIPTVSGPKSDVVNQRMDAGFWVMIGAFEMERGEQTVRIENGGEGEAVIDAVMVVQDAVIAPNGDTASVVDPEALAPVAGSEGTTSRMATVERARSGSTRADVVRTAKRHIGTRYGWRTCRINVSEDCSCHTRLVYKRFGYTLPDSPLGQWRYGKRVTGRRALGDLVFHDLDNSGSLENNWDDHVSIYAGNGYIIHASSYFGKVVRSEMKYLPRYYGAKRLRLR